MLCSQEYGMKILLDFVIHDYVHWKFWTTNHLFADSEYTVKSHKF